MAAHCRARPGSANSACTWAPRVGRASTGMLRYRRAPRPSRSMPSSRSPNRADRLRAAILFLRHQIHRAELEGPDGRGGAGPGIRAHDHDGPRRLRHDVADGAEPIELGHLQIHQAPGRARGHGLSAARPSRSRAVPTTRNSPTAVDDVGQQPPEEGAVVDHQDRGAAQSVLDTMRHRADFDPAVCTPTAGPSGRSRRRPPRR